MGYLWYRDHLVFQYTLVVQQVEIRELNELAYLSSIRRTGNNGVYRTYLGRVRVI